MSNQPQPAKPDAQKPTDPYGPRIPISLLQSLVERQWPGGEVSYVCEARPTAQLTQKRWLIDFLPKLGMYEVRYFGPNQTSPHETRLVPKEWASGTVIPG